MLPIGRGSHLMSDSIQVEHLDVVKFDYRIVRLFCFTCGVSAFFLEQKSQKSDSRSLKELACSTDLDL